LDNILTSQRSPSIKFGLGFYETIKGESSSQDFERNLRDNNEKSKILDKDIRNQLDQQPKKVNLKRKSFAPNYRSINHFSPMDNDVECFIFHKFGHFAANFRSRYTRISLCTQVYLRDIVFLGTYSVTKLLIAIGGI